MIGSYLKQTCTITPKGTPDQFGGYTEGTPATYACRFRRRSHYVTGPDGKVVLSSGDALLPAGASVASGDTLTYAGTDYRVLSVADAVTPWGKDSGREVVLV